MYRIRIEIGLEMLSCFFGLLLMITSAENHTGKIPAPRNLTTSIKNPFDVTWSWSPPHGVAADKGCIKYLSSLNSKKYVWDFSLSRQVYFALNDEITFHVKAFNNCDSSKEGEWANISLPAPPGDVESSVKNFQCVIYEEGCMNCTWQPGTKPHFAYSLYYWQTNLGELQMCREYIVSDGVRQGCHFHKSKEQWNASHIVYILVNGSQDYAEIRPFYSEVDPQTIVKPYPPNITSITLKKRKLFVEWTEPSHFPAHCIAFDLRYKDSKLTHWIDITGIKDPKFSINIDLQAKYMFQVRSQYNVYCGSKSLGEWSEVKYYDSRFFCCLRSLTQESFSKTCLKGMERF
ncbi:interleukin-13 receptor subunit alpha-1-like isoform X2 [Polyodon spathula]|uniref:interleukin-13 receptor subunit alpha-1-like isoform X2 n=1 Tax=Polyodon spathula TaxID=7913 RepID=UPI001B7F4EDB|nr:interleukin-13 receptor subunit alpha-1-like isoform X2 [Polyodon spathula]